MKQFDHQVEPRDDIEVDKPTTRYLMGIRQPHGGNATGVDGLQNETAASAGLVRGLDQVFVVIDRPLEGLADELGHVEIRIRLG